MNTFEADSTLIRVLFPTLPIYSQSNISNSLSAILHEFVQVSLLKSVYKIINILEEYITSHESVGFCGSDSARIFDYNEFGIV